MIKSSSAELKIVRRTFKSINCNILTIKLKAAVNNCAVKILMLFLLQKSKS